MHGWKASENRWMDAWTHGCMEQAKSAAMCIARCMDARQAKIAGWMYGCLDEAKIARWVHMGMDAKKRKSLECAYVHGCKASENRWLDQILFMYLYLFAIQYPSINCILSSVGAYSRA